MLLLILIFIFLVIFTRPITVFFHELGHGIIALLLTKEKVTLYIGSYGDPKKSLNFKLGRLEFFFKYDLTLWKLGLCVPHDNDVSINRQLMIVVFGPIFSILLGTLCYYIVFESDFHNGLKLIGFVILISSLFDFIINIIPRKEPIKLFNGTTVYNDGKQLKQLLEHRGLPFEYKEGIEYYINKDYKKASKSFYEVIKQGIQNEHVYRLAIYSYLQLNDDATALELHNEFEKHFKLNSDDYANSGLIKTRLGLYSEGMPDYDKSLELNPDNRYSLNNRGYTYNLLNEYEKAIIDFDKAINIQPEFAYSYNNRGLAKIKLGKEKEGLKDIETSMSLDDNNSYAYKNLGIYYFDKGIFDKALALFEKARELDKDTHLISEYIDKTKEKL